MNVEGLDQGLLQLFKEVAAEEKDTIKAAIIKGMTLYINKNSARTRMESRITKLLKNFSIGGEFSEKALFNLLNEDEFVTMKTCREVQTELILRKCVTCTKREGVYFFRVEKVEL